MTPPLWHDIDDDGRYHYSDHYRDQPPRKSRLKRAPHARSVADTGGTGGRQGRIGLNNAGARDLTSLDAQQLTVEVPFAWHPSQEWRFRGCRGERENWLRLLPKMGLNQKAVNKYAECGQGAWIQWSESRGCGRIVAKTCRSRACPICRKTQAKQLQQRLDWALPAGTGKNLRLVTLTLKHSSRPLREQLDFLRASFRRLRQRKFWRRHTRYGYGIIEIGYNEKTKKWHPHLHVIAHGKWMEQRTLANEWAAVTHGSRIVDLRAIRNRERAVSYVLKYMSKGPEGRVLASEARMLEWWEAVRGGRLFLKFGHEIAALPSRIDDGYPNDWQWVEPLNILLKRIEAGNEKARAQLESLGHMATDIEHPYDYLFDDNPP